MKTIVIVSDVFIGEQVNGVGTWLIHTTKELEKKGFAVHVVDSRLFKHTFAIPGYPEIRLVFTRRKSVEKIIQSYKPDYIHIVTEGTLGFLARLVCVKNHWNFTSAYHTRFPEYIFARTKIKFFETITYTYMRWLHNKSAGTIVTTESMKQELEQRQFEHVIVVPLGVDTELFSKNEKAEIPPQLEKPIFVYFGRISTEKNVEAFLQCRLPGSKLVIGDGPERKKLEELYTRKTLFVGYKRGKALVDLLSIAQVCVFTSKTDTFGLTIIEALSCGLPVAGYNVQGPKNIITQGKDGFLGENLEENAIKCLHLSSAVCRETAEQYSWASATALFLGKLISVK